MASLFDDWAKAKDYIAAALEHIKGTHTIDDVALLVGAGHLKVWLGNNFAMLTEICASPRLRWVNVFAAGGNLQELQNLEADLVKYAKDNNCSRITAFGRDGWLKVLPGCQKMGVAMYRDI